MTRAYIAFAPLVGALFLLVALLSGCTSPDGRFSGTPGYYRSALPTDLGARFGILFEVHPQPLPAVPAEK